MNACELQQFNYFIKFLEKKHGMLKALKNKNWEDIASGYNGTEWRKHNPTYASDLNKFYEKYKTQTAATK